MARTGLDEQMERKTGRKEPGRLVAGLLAFTALLLVLLAGLSLLYLELPATADQPVGHAANPDAAVDLVNRFYDGVNEAIRSGEITLLSTVVAPGFSEYPARIGMAGGRDGLYQSLLALRSVAPEARLVVDSVEASVEGDLLSVRVHVVGAESAAFLDLAPPVELAGWGWGPVELLRVADGLISERWAGSADGTLLEPLVTCDPVPFETPTVQRVAALVRLVIATETEFRIADLLSTRFLFVESGAVSVGVTPQDPAASSYSVRTGATLDGLPSHPESAVSLVSGEHLATRSKSTTVIVNQGSQPASLLMVTWYVMSMVAAPQAGPAAQVFDDVAKLNESGRPAVSARPLALGVAPVTNNAGCALGRVTMPAGSTLTWQSSTSVLIAVDDGRLLISTRDVRIDGTRATGEPWYGESTTLSAGDGTHVMAGTGFTWRNTGNAPVTMIVLTMDAI